MEQARQRIEAIKQLQRERLQGGIQTPAEYGVAHDSPQYLTALGVVAVGLMIAAVIWQTTPLVTEDNSISIRPQSAEAISADEFRKTSENIARLNHRLESFADTIYSMDAKFEHILVMADSKASGERKYAYPLQKISNNIAHEAEQEFVPTHRVNARINLRPSMALNTIPIAVLDTGTEVEYISETDGWYYVNTRSHGKGWCSSDYLSSLRHPKQGASQG